jgi:hypothetical protein
MSREVQAGTLWILFLSLIAGCGGERRSAAAPADTATAPAPDTSAARRDTTPKAPAPSVAEKKPAPKPAPVTKPTTPKPTAPVAQPTAPPAPPAEPAQSADAPLRDAYHQAPLDTVAQVVYDGWKQFNLNCARCHGEDVQGTTIAPHLIVSLRPDGPINTKEIFMQTVCAGRPAKGMPSWCALGMDMGKIESIYSYVKGRSDGKIHPGRPAVKPAG